MKVYVVSYINRRNKALHKAGNAMDRKANIQHNKTHAIRRLYVNVWCL